MADEEVRISASLSDDMSAALERIEQRIGAVEREVDQLGIKGRAAGRGAGAGFDEFGDKVEKAGAKARRARRPIGEVGDESIKSGAKAAIGAEGFHKLAEKLDKVGKKGGDFGSIFKMLKWPAIITGAYAAAGGISALGAGAVIAVGAMAPMVGVFAGILPLFAAGKLGMLAWKLAATQLEPSLTRIKNQFTELGPVIAKGGLQQGVDYFANSIGKLTKVTGVGLAGLGGEIGLAAHNAGDLAKSAPFLAQVSDIFAGLRPILRFILSGLMAIAQAAMNVLQAALPAATGMAAAFEWIATSLRNWTAAQLANGKMAAFITKAWQMFVYTAGIVVDFMIGVFNIFKIGAGYAGNLGTSIHDMAYQFRLWTTSAAGQDRINQYFRDSLPALQEMGKLVRTVVGFLAGLGASQNVAPLLAAINTQLLPALMILLTHLTGVGGLGPSLISAAASAAMLFAGLDFSGLNVFVQAIDGLLKTLVWLQQNVPGANFLISSLLFSMLGFKLLGPVFKVIGKGADAFAWMIEAKAATGELTLAQKIFQGTLSGLGKLFSGLGTIVMDVVVPALRMIAIAGVGALRTLSVALFTTPIGWIILAIIAIIVAIYLLWTKCAWFRDAVKAVWEAIKTAGIAVWNALKTAFFAVISALVTAWNAVRDAFVAVWNWLKSAWQSTVDFFIMVGMWIWDHGLKQVLAVIITYFTITFSVIKFIVQTAIYIMIAIIVVIATVLKATWDAIVMVATWAWGVIVDAAKWAWGVISDAAQWFWNTILKPLIDAVVAAWTTAWGAVVAAATWVWNMISAGAQWFWNTILKPIIDFIVLYFTTAWNLVSAAAQFLWNAISAGVNWLWVTILQPIFNVIGAAGSAVWGVISTAAQYVWDAIKTGWSSVWDFLSGIWGKLQSAGTGVWDAIKSAASSVGDAVKGVWDGIKGAVAGVWNFLARGWNSIPDITVPDWVPLIGGKTFGLPKLPTLWHGGMAPGGAAIVGEHGPEPLVVNGRFSGMVGMGGPEIASIPRGGYVVPNLSTLSALPGLAKSLPSGVARAVAGAVPGYGPVTRSSGGDGTAGALHAIAAAVADRPPPIVAYGKGVAEEVEYVLRKREREHELTAKYRYGGGRG